ncbi:ArnT family glycosyltransferase, partial [Humibacter sp.]|uniref:ArnT family glycosyltransferase n=1 Tax=Humibacter sp. TaxID=1940291 RepID=UPI003F7E8C7C
GIDPVVGGRLVSLIFYAGLLVALWLLGRRIAGRWGALIAIVVPLALNTNQLPSPVQGPVDILGEFPAAALIAWSIVFVRRRPWLAGLFLGLAIQTKFISLLAAPALLVYAWLVIADEPWRARLKRCIWFSVWAAIPTAVYWLAVLVSLGPSGFVSNAHQFLAFLKSGGQTAAVPPDQKLTALMGSWFVDSRIVIVVVIAALVIGVLAVIAVRMAVRSGESADALVQDAVAQTSARDVTFLLIAAAVNLIAWVGWWSLSRGTPTWIRYPSTGLVVSIPIFAAAAVLGVRMLWVRAAHRAPRPVPGRARAAWLRWTAAGVAAVLCALFVASTTSSVQQHTAWVQVPDYAETLSQQRDVAHQLAELGDKKFATPWGGQLGAILLSGVSFTNQAGPETWTLPNVLWNPSLTDVGEAGFDKLVNAMCKRDVVRIAAQYAVCRLS